MAENITYVEIDGAIIGGITCSDVIEPKMIFRRLLLCKTTEVTGFQGEEGPLGSIDIPYHRQILGSIGSLPLPFYENRVRFAQRRAKGAVMSLHKK